MEAWVASRSYRRAILAKLNSDYRVVGTARTMRRHQRIIDTAWMNGDTVQRTVDRIAYEEYGRQIIRSDER